MQQLDFRYASGGLLLCKDCLLLCKKQPEVSYSCGIWGIQL